MLLLKIAKFALAGLIGVAVDFSTTYFCKEKLSINKYIANIFGFILAASANFFVNKYWTFSDDSTVTFIQYFKYVSVASTGLLINQLVIVILHEKLKWEFYWSKISANLLVTLWNFLLIFFLVF
jgi:putative flippase GtrA